MGGFIDMTGKKYGMLTVIERTGTANDKQALWKCKCDCGNFHTSKGRDLRCRNYAFSNQIPFANFRHRHQRDYRAEVKQAVGKD